jgi:hypothetical protein
MRGLYRLSRRACLCSRLSGGLHFQGITTTSSDPPFRAKTILHGGPDRPDLQPLFRQLFRLPLYSNNHHFFVFGPVKKLILGELIEIVLFFS